MEVSLWSAIALRNTFAHEMDTRLQVKERSLKARMVRYCVWYSVAVLILLTGSTPSWERWVLSSEHAVESQKLSQCPGCTPTSSCLGNLSLALALFKRLCTIPVCVVLKKIFKG